MWTDIRNWKYDWMREEPFWRRGTIGELFADLRGDRWLWVYVLSPYLGLCFVRSIIWSVNALRRPKQLVS
ncbi:MAG TPA: hypothetical protein VL136_03275 [Candidatus Babeliales bacterium]|nr:hypothetical protein [Candidatus Babeliales bacterium]